MKPHSIKSSWNQLKIIFVSDFEVESSGFRAYYTQLSYQLPAGFPAFGQSEGRSRTTHKLELIEYIINIIQYIILYTIL